MKENRWKQQRTKPPLPVKFEGLFNHISYPKDFYALKWEFIRRDREYVKLIERIAGKSVQELGECCIVAPEAFKERKKANEPTRTLYDEVIAVDEAIRESREFVMPTFGMSVEFETEFDTSVSEIYYEWEQDKNSRNILFLPLDLFLRSCWVNILLNRRSPKRFNQLHYGINPNCEKLPAQLISEWAPFTLVGCYQEFEPYILKPAVNPQTGEICPAEERVTDFKQDYICLLIRTKPFVEHKKLVKEIKGITETHVPRHTKTVKLQYRTLDQLRNDLVSFYDLRRGQGWRKWAKERLNERRKDPKKVVSYKDGRTALDKEIDEIRPKYERLKRWVTRDWYLI
jgi:hypothetical protein